MFRLHQKEKVCEPVWTGQWSNRHVLTRTHPWNIRKLPLSEYRAFLVLKISKYYDWVDAIETETNFPFALYDFIKQEENKNEEKRMNPSFIQLWAIADIVYRENSAHTFHENVDSFRGAQWTRDEFDWYSFSPDPKVSFSEYTIDSITYTCLRNTRIYAINLVE